MLPVWVLALVGVILVAVLAPGGYLDWLPVGPGAAVVVTFVIQLALPRKTGFVARATLSVCGVVVLLALATVVLAASSPAVG